MDSSDKVVALVKGSAILTFSNICIKGINFFLLPLYTKYLNPIQLGISDTITTMVSFVFPILVLGLDSAFSAFFFDKQTLNYQKKVFNTVDFVLMAMSSISIVLILFSKQISEILLGTDEYQLLVGTAMLSMTVNLWYLPYSLLVRVQNRMTVFAVINVIASLSMIGFNILFVTVFKLEEYALILSTFCIQVIQLILFIFLGKAKIEKRYFDSQLAKHMLKYAVPLIPTVIATWVLTASVRYILLYFKGEFEVGIFGIGTRFATMINVLANSVYMAYTTYAFSAKNDENSKDQYPRVLDGFFFLLIMIIFVVSVFAKEIVEVMADPQYREAYKLIAGLLFAQLIYAINTIIGYGVAFKKKSVYMAISVAIGAAFNLALNLILIPYAGTEAVAYTTVIAYTAMAAASYFFAQKVYPCNYRMKRMAGVTALLFGATVCLQENDIAIKIIVSGLGIIMVSFLYKDVVRDIKLLIKKLTNR